MCIGGLVVRFVMIAALVLAMGLTTPVMAQEAPGAHQRALAERLINLSTGSGLQKMIERQIESQLASVDNVPAAEAAWIRDNMPRMMLRMADTMMADMVDVYAEVFTEAELEAQITFFESPLGPSIANKTLDLGARQQAILGEVMLTFLEEFVAKYCAEFDCSAAAAGKTRGR